MKRGTSFTSSSALSTPTQQPSKKKACLPQVEGVAIDDSNSSFSPSQQENKGFVFKDEDFEPTSSSCAVMATGSSDSPHSGVKSGKKRMWKSLKQILSSERSLQWSQDDTTYSSLEAPPSFQPAKKYSDISGREALYTDPQTKLQYATAAEFRAVRQLPYDIIQGHLSLRNATAQS